jgi:hypothetical protein
VDDGLRISFPVRFSAWVILTERYRVTLAKRRSMVGLRGLWGGLKKLAWFSWCCFALASMQIGLQLFLMFVVFSMWASYHAGRPLSGSETWAVFDQVMTNIFTKGGCSQ